MLEMTTRILSVLPKAPTSISTRVDHKLEEWENGFAIDGSIEDTEKFLTSKINNLKKTHKSESETILMNGIPDLYICINRYKQSPKTRSMIFVRVLPTSWYDMHGEGSKPYATNSRNR